MDRDRYHLANTATYGRARRYIDDTGRLSLRRQQGGRGAAGKAHRRRAAQPAPVR